MQILCLFNNEKTFIEVYNVKLLDSNTQLFCFVKLVRHKSVKRHSECPLHIANRKDRQASRWTNGQAVLGVERLCF